MRTLTHAGLVLTLHWGMLITGSTFSPTSIKPLPNSCPVLECQPVFKFLDGVWEGVPPICSFPWHPDTSGLRLILHYPAVPVWRHHLSLFLSILFILFPFDPPCPSLPVDWQIKQIWKEWVAVISRLAIMHTEPWWVSPIPAWNNINLPAALIPSE